jgi:predicted SprT family Zn-dependent metalloprotease
MTYYTKLSKPSTSYNQTTAPSGTWFLNSTFLTLNNVVYRLNGYSTAVVPAQLNNKNAITYAEA